MNNMIFRVRTALFYIFLVFWSLPILVGIIQYIMHCELPTMGKTIYMFGETHTDPFDAGAVAQRQELELAMDTIMDQYHGPMSLYLECNNNLQEWVRELSWLETWDLCRRGSFFEQWYIPLGYADGMEVQYGQLLLSNFDIRDDQYTQFKYAFIELAEDVITSEAIDFEALHHWADMVVEPTIKTLLGNIKKVYPKKLASYVSRDIGRKKSRFYTMLNAYRQEKTAYCGTCALNDFYDFTDLLPELTILNKVASDPCEAIVVNAGAAHTQNLSRYFRQL